MAGTEATKSESKRRKLDEDEQVSDRISALPDELLAFILSGIPTRQAVQTCILSKRWKSTWTAVFNLFFDQGNTEPPRSFAKYVDKVFSLHNAFSLKKFVLGCKYESYHSLPISSWINAAETRNLQCLDITICNSSLRAPLLDYVYACQRLQVLKLTGDFTLQVPNSVSLNNLKILHLNNINFLDGRSLSKLLSGCPLLEELRLYFPSTNAHRLRISSQSLKSLKVHRFRDDSRKIGIVVDAPNLRYINLFFRFGGVKQLSLKNTPSLVSATIWSQEFTQEDEFFIFLGSISNIERLKLGSMHFKITKGSDQQNEVLFHKLKQLDMKIITGYSLLLYLLERSPNLASLTLQCEEIEKSPDSYGADYLCSHLEEVMIKKFKGEEYEIKIMRCLLMKGPVLKKMTIYPTKWFADYLPKNEDFLKELSMLPRTSTTCQIVVSYD